MGLHTLLSSVRYVILHKFNLTRMCKPELWSPWNDLTLGMNYKDYAILILNTPINLNIQASVMLTLWNRATLRITVDGGTDRWISWLRENMSSVDTVKPPDIVSGDMDSISQDVLHYYMEMNQVTHVVHTPDQDETDFTKALREMKHYLSKHSLTVDAVYVIADTSGRFDQVIANINTLYKANSIIPGIKVFQLSKESLTWLLNNGYHSIEIPEILRESEEWCALMPIGNPCQVTTKGLKWNLNKTVMEFGKLVSTSNTYSGEENVYIESDRPLVWSMGIESLWTV